MRKYILISLVLLFSCANPAYAFEDGSGWQVVALLKKYLGDFKAFMKTANENAELLREVKALKQHDASSFQVFENPEFKKYVGDLGATDFAGVTTKGLKDFTDIDRSLAQIAQEKNKLTPKQRVYWERNQDALMYYRKLEYLRRSAMRNLKKSGQDNSVRSSSQITSNATSTMANIMIQNAQKKKQDEVLQNELNSDGVKTQQDVNSALTTIKSPSDDYIKLQ